LIKYTDKNSVLEAIQDEYKVLEYTSRELRSDKDILIEAIRKHNYPIDYLTKILQIERSIAVEMKTEVLHLNMYNSALDTRE